MDRQLEAGLRKGRPESFERLFELYADALSRLGYALLSNGSDVEDIVQESLIGFVEALRDGRFRGGNGTVEAYLRRSVRNRCIDRLRRRGMLNVSLDGHEELSLEAPEQPLLPPQALEEKRLQNYVESAIRNLPAAQRTVIALRVLENYSYRDIAHELNVSLDYVKNLMARARKRLREELKPFLEGM